MLFLVPIGILLTGCPYDSPVPITKAGIPVPGEFLGHWMKTDESDEEEHPTHYHLVKKDATSCTLYEIKHNEPKDDSTVYIAHFSKINQTIFLNLRQANKGDPEDMSYYLYRIKSEGKTLVLDGITDNIREKFKTPEELHAFVKANMHLSFFYNHGDQIKLKKKGGK